MPPVWSAKANAEILRLTTVDKETVSSVNTLRGLIDQWADQHPVGMHVQKFSGNGLKVAVSVTIKDHEVITVERR